MDLYLYREGQVEGPYSFLDIRTQILKQILQPSDLGWGEGFEDWRPLSEIPGLIHPVAIPFPPTAPSVQESDRKRKLPSLSHLHFAGFGLRLVARMIDGMIIFLACTPIDFFCANRWLGGIHLSFRGDQIIFPWQMYWVNLAIGWVYFAGFEASPLQGTPGKRFMNLRVIDFKGQRASIFRTAVRYPSKVLSTALLLFPIPNSALFLQVSLRTLAIVSIFGYLMVLWTYRKRALHDFIADTYVIRDF